MHDQRNGSSEPRNFQNALPFDHKLAVLAGWLLSASLALGAHVLRDPGFEANPAGANVKPIAGWQSSGPNAFTESGAYAHSGSNYFKVYGCFCGNTNVSGSYQDNPSLPGAIWSADAWAFSLSTDGIHGEDQVWVEITFRDSMLNALAMYRSSIFNSNNIGSLGGFSKWFDLRVTNQWSFSNSGDVAIGVAPTNTVTNLVAPPGTVLVRCQIVFQQGPDNANGSAYFDDCTLTQIGGPIAAWNIVWSDEFNGSSISPTNWTFENGNNGGWGNNELEYYTSNPQNAYVSNGLLHIVALQQSDMGFSYTSARMKTQGLYSKEYGQIEFRAKLPSGFGFWPALWLLGTNITSVGWPGCGEIDVMENKGSALANVQGSLHSGSDETAVYTLPNGGSVTDFHTYLLQWLANSIQWYVDGQLYETQTNWSSSQGPYPTPFNKPFFIIMNLAVGGNYIQSPAPTVSEVNSNTVFPGEMQVDYVRVYDLTAPMQISITESNSQVLLTWPSNIVCHLQAQTNGLGAEPGWANVNGARAPFAVPAIRSAATVFYRLVSP